MSARRWITTEYAFTRAFLTIVSRLVLLWPDLASPARARDDERDLNSTCNKKKKKVRKGLKKGLRERERYIQIQ